MFGIRQFTELQYTSVINVYIYNRVDNDRPKREYDIYCTELDTIGTKINN